MPTKANNGSFYQESFTVDKFTSSTGGADIAYNPDEYKVGNRIVRTLDPATELTNYDECVNASLATDKLVSYRFDPHEMANSVSIDLYKENTTFQVEFVSDEPITIYESDNYWLRVAVEHRGNAYSPDAPWRTRLPGGTGRVRLHRDRLTP